MTRMLLAMLAFYRRWISPALHSIGPGGGCRFVPTCSEYATTAIATHGPMRGVALAIWRVLRCHPFSRGGLDQVPGTQKSKERFVETPGTGTSNSKLHSSKCPESACSGHLPHEPLT